MKPTSLKYYFFIGICQGKGAKRPGHKDKFIPISWDACVYMCVCVRESVFIMNATVPNADVPNVSVKLLIAI